MARRLPLAVTAAPLLAILLLAAACASGPVIEDAGDPDPAPTATRPTEPPPPADGPEEEPEATVPGDTRPDAGEPPPPGRIPVGRIVTRGEAAGEDAIVVYERGRATPLDTGVAPRQPTWSRDGARLALSAQEVGSPVVEVFAPDGTRLDRAESPRPHFFFSWSHDGTRIAALGPADGDEVALDLLDADGAVVAEAVATGDTVYVGWDPDSPTLAVHADDDLLRVDADGTVTDLGAVGAGFFAPKWIPGTGDLLVVVDVEGTATLVRRGADPADTLRSLGAVPEPLGIAVHPAGDVAALTLLGLPADGGGPREISAGVRPVQEETGTVDLVDLETGERVPAFTGRALWTEWSPTGEHLLIGEVRDGGGGAGTWWLLDGDAAADGTVDDDERRPVADFVAPEAFLLSYLAFGDQYVEQPRLWAPTGEAFVHPTVTAAGDLLTIVPVEPDAEPRTLGPGVVGFWSPEG